MNKKELEREMRRLLSTGKATDKKQAQVILAQIGRETKAVKREATKQQTTLF